MIQGGGGGVGFFFVRCFLTTCTRFIFFKFNFLQFVGRYYILLRH